MADDALCPHLLGRQLAVAVGELERVGGVGEALAAEDGRTLAAEELGQVFLLSDSPLSKENRRIRHETLERGATPDVIMACGKS